MVNGMNTHTATRALLATVTAGALALGSAAGAIAAPVKGKPVSNREFIALRTVDIHRHSPVNVYSDAVARGITLRANVWDTVKTADPQTVTITLAHYAKRRGALADPAAFAPITTELTLVAKDKRKKSKNYTAFLPGAAIRAAVGDRLPVGASGLICIQSAEVTVAAGVNLKADRKPVLKKENGGDCVRVVNVDPATTETTSDDPAPAPAKTARPAPAPTA